MLKIPLKHCRKGRKLRVRRFLCNQQPSVADVEIARRAATWRANLANNTSAVLTPRSIFPWRHEEVPLPRLDQSNYLGPGLPAFPVWYQWCVTHFTLHLLKVPWHCLIFGEWKKEFADSSAWAFNQAVSGVMSNSFHVPFSEIRSEKDDFMVNLDHIIERPAKLDLGDEEVSPDLEDMVEANLKNLYMSANKHGKDHLQIKLKMRPTSASILSAYCIPFLTREKVKTDPSLQSTFSDIYLKAEEHQGYFDACRFVFSELRSLGHDQTECKTDHAVLNSTVIVQVMVECEEIFQVSCARTGHILQGHKDGKIRKIPHVVRLEAVISSQRPYVNGKAVAEIGAWQITDWDDLLGGNIWYL